MAYLAVNGLVHSVITEDSDLLPYGCPRVSCNPFLVSLTHSHLPMKSCMLLDAECAVGTQLASSGTGALPLVTVFSASVFSFCQTILFWPALGGSIGDRCMASCVCVCVLSNGSILNGESIAVHK